MYVDIISIEWERIENKMLALLVLLTEIRSTSFCFHLLIVWHNAMRYCDVMWYDMIDIERIGCRLCLYRWVAVIDTKFGVLDPSSHICTYIVYAYVYIYTYVEWLGLMLLHWWMSWNQRYLITKVWFNHENYCMRCIG